MSELLTCEHLSKEYKEDASTVNVLKDVNFSVSSSEQVAILGSSGSGKSTLLHLLGALDTPTSGKVYFKNQDIFQFTHTEQSAFRNKSLGFVYQFHHLLPEFSALENVAMPLLIGKKPRKVAESKAREMLQKVGLEHRLDHRPAKLSGGERQRVAIARALVNEPALVLADEPTGNLDHKTGESIYQLIKELKEQIETCFIIVTHDTELAGRLDRVLSLVDGVMTEQAR